MLASNTSKAIFQGNNVTTNFPFTFKVWDASQLTVEVTNPQGFTQQATSWTVELTDNGGTVTYLHGESPLPEGYKLTILRHMPFTQEVDLITGTRFDPQVIEDALDKATAERQQLFEAVERSIKTLPTDTKNPDELLTEIREGAAHAVESANIALTNAELAQDSKEQCIVSAQNAANSAIQAQQSAENAAQDASGAIALVEAEGTKQVQRVQQEGEEQRSHITQTITPDPTQASSRNVPSEQAVSQFIAALPEPETGEDYIIDYYPKTEAEKASANGNWWRKWNSGFIEQGGRITNTATTILNLLVAFSNTNYIFTKAWVATTTDHISVDAMSARSKSTTQVGIRNPATISQITWEAKGY